MTKTIRWGIAGPGNIAKKFAKAIKNVEGAELVAVASRKFDSAKDFAEKYDIPNIFEGYENMAKSDLVDAVYVATPHPFHKSTAEIFLNAKKHVLCEKPICVNAKQAQSLADCAKENGVFLMEAMWTRFLPAVNEVMKVARSGEIGDVRGFSADFCYSISKATDSKVFANEMAGGSLLDVGVYCLHVISMLFGYEPSLISAVADIQEGVDRHTDVCMKYSDASLAHFTSAVDVLKPETAFIYGTEGFIEIPYFYMANQFNVNVRGVERKVAKKCIGDGFEEEIIEVCNCIREGKLQSSVNPLENSIKIIKQMDEIRNQIGLSYPFDK